MSAHAITLNDWVDVVRRMRLGPTVKAVAQALADFADPDGTRVFPGLARLTYVTELHYLTVKRAVKRLRDIGLILKVGKRGNADEYRLVLPADLLDRFYVPSPAEAEAEIEKIRKANQRHSPRKVQVPTAPVSIDSGDDVQVPTAPVKRPLNDRYTGAQGTPTETSTGAQGTAVQVPTAPATLQYPPHKSTLHSGEELRADLTHPRDQDAPTQDQKLADVIPINTPTGADGKCEPHRRPIGQCHFCRRGLPGDGAKPRNGQRVITPKTTGARHGQNNPPT